MCLEGTWSAHRPGGGVGLTGLERTWGEITDGGGRGITTRVGLGKGTVECPIEDCKVELLLEDCKSLADGGQIDLMLHRKKEAAINVLDRVYCPNSTCSYLMSRGSLLKSSKSVFADAGQSGARKCQNCGFCFCISCQDKWHYGMSCENFRKTAPYKASGQAHFEDTAHRNGWRKCIQCSCWLELDEGCMHMTCWTCSYEFCYTCGEPWVMKKPTCRCPFRVEEGLTI
ncbi:E3 ubiquitin-protein ligase RSL1 [Cardamine amara subsp. amara]|uniref:RBR-type E3 ubiquitin transferase n=1 Tax=Cardamine amara subsp. amara TaxID=228776 RepID=A0ABD0ZK79_CARAN